MGVLSIYVHVTWLNRLWVNLIREIGEIPKPDRDRLSLGGYILEG